MSSSNSYIKNKFSLTSLLAERLIERVVEELWREMKKIELIMKHLLANIGKMSNSYFLLNISIFSIFMAVKVCRGKSCLELEESSLVLISDTGNK